MNAKAKKLLKDLHTDIKLLGFTDLANRVLLLEKELTPAPKKLKVAEVANFKIIVTEGPKSYEVLLAEKDLDKWLIMQAKNRRASMDHFFKSQKVSIPSWSHRSDEREKQLEKHHGLINEAGRNYSLLIQRL